MKTTGLFRQVLEDGAIAWAQVTDGTRRFNVPEEMYRSQGYQPPFEQLPDRAGFEAAVKVGLMMAGMNAPFDDTPPEDRGTSH